MDTLIVAVLSFVGFIVAYHTYGRWIANKIFGLEDQAVTPSWELQMVLIMCQLREGLSSVTILPVLLVLDLLLDRQ